MRYLLLFLLFVALNISLKADDQVAKVFELNGIENPICIDISFDGMRMLIIDHPNKGTRRIFESVYHPELKKWDDPKPVEVINKLLTENSNVNSPFYAYNLPVFYFSANLEGGYGGQDIYYCEWKGQNWGAPKNIGPSINTDADEDSPSLSATNREFYFVRQNIEAMEDKIYGGELYEVEMNDAGQWATPVLLNKAINSTYLRSVKVMEDNKTFFYAAYDDDKKWQLGWSRKIMDDGWYYPVFLNKVNTSDSEYCPVLSREEKQFYFILNKGKDHKPKNKIYTSAFPDSLAPLPTFWLSGKISDRNTGKPIEERVVITHPLTAEVICNVNSAPDDGNWKTLLNANEAYSIEFIKRGFSYAKQDLLPQHTRRDTTIVTNLFSSVFLKLNAYDSETLVPLKPNLELHTFEGEIVPANVERSFDGQGIIEIPVGYQYYLIANQENFKSDSIPIDLSHLLIFDHFEKDIELQAIKKEFIIDVTDAETDTPLTVNVIIRDKKTNVEYVADVERNAEGKYVVQLREGGDYEVNIRGPKGYSFYNDQVNLDKEKKSYQMKIRLEPLKAKTKIQLKNIQFEYNSADLQEISYTELNRVVDLMKDNPQIKIEISAHTDDKGANNYNLKLSDKRAFSVVNYLINKGVLVDRLVARGYGETTPLVENSTDANRAINRRVELKVVDIEMENDLN